MKLLERDRLRERGLDLWRNYLANEKWFAKSKQIRGLQNIAKGVPAIVCGGGPSLAMPHHEGIVFAGGTALPALKEMGITPDFVGGIDPSPLPDRMKGELFPEVPAFFRSSVHPEFLEGRKGERILVPGNGGDLFDDTAFDGGWTVTTFLVAVAHFMGCSPLVLTGVDLAKDAKGPCYAGALERTEGGKWLDIGGGLESRLDWIAAADWLTKRALQDPQTEWINLSGGRALEGFATQWIGPGAKRTIDLAALPTGGYQGVSVAEMEESFANVERLIDALLIAMERTHPKLPRGEADILCVELEDALAYRTFLGPVWEVWSREFPEMKEAFTKQLNRLLFCKGVCDDR